MAEIHVIFQKTAKPIVYNMSTPVLKDEYIFWHIHCEDSEIKKVKIAFEGTKGRGPAFFRTDTGNLNEITKDLSKRKFIWGMSPHPMGNGHQKDKYSIYGLDANEKPVAGAYLDPMILSDDP